jgi:hypothetical protein
MLSPSVILSEVRVYARESKDPGAAVGDHADSGSSTETCFMKKNPIWHGGWCDFTPFAKAAKDGARAA